MSGYQPVMGDIVRLKNRKAIGSLDTGRINGICGDVALVFWNEADIDQWMPTKLLEPCTKTKTS